MTDRDLRSLKDVPVPAPRADAKARALRAAVEAVESNAAKEVETDPKDEVGAPRLMLVTSNDTRSIEMKKFEKPAQRWFTPRRSAIAAISRPSCPAIVEDDEEEI